MNMRKRDGFTLLEILIVIAVIAALAGLLAPALLQSRERSRQAYCTNNLKQLYSALRLYADSCDGAFPPKYLADAVTFIHADKAILTCPSDDFYVNPYTPDPWDEHPEKRTSYDWPGALLSGLLIPPFKGNGADNLAYMEAKHPTDGLIACDHHGYIQNRVHDRPCKVLRLAFDGSVKAIIIQPDPLGPNAHTTWSLSELLGWDFHHMK